MPRKPKKRGRPSRYRREFAQQLVDYFSAPAQRVARKIEKYPDGALKSSAPVALTTPFPTFEAFAAAIGVARSTLYAWETDHPTFAEACRRAREQQIRFIVENGLNGNYSTSFAQYLLGVLSRGGDLTPGGAAAGQQEQPLTVNVVYPGAQEEKAGL